MRRTLALAALALVSAGCGGSSSASHSSSTSVTQPASNTTTAAQQFQAPLVLTQAQQAPNIVLRDQNGHVTSLAQFRGKAVMVTFVYTHCPDVCPLIMQALGAARHDLGADASKLAIVAVSVDPKGDTPASVRHYLEVRKLESFTHYLLGTRPQLARVWRAWNISSRSPKGTPEQIAHSSVIYGIDASGMIRTLYPAQPLDPKAIAHDAKLLAQV
jgi:protein SCO1/2